MELCRQAMNGDDGSLQELSLDEINLNVPKHVSLDVRSLQLEFTSVDNSNSREQIEKNIFRTTLYRQDEVH